MSHNLGGMTQNRLGGMCPPDFKPPDPASQHITAPSNPKKRRKTSNANAAAQQPTPTPQDLLPPPPLGYDTIVASNPFDDTPSGPTMPSGPVHHGGGPGGPGAGGPMMNMMHGGMNPHGIPPHQHPGHPGHPGHHMHNHHMGGPPLRGMHPAMNMNPMLNPNHPMNAGPGGMNSRQGGMNPMLLERSFNPEKVQIIYLYV